MSRSFRIKLVRDIWEAKERLHYCRVQSRRSGLPGISPPPQRTFPMLSRHRNASSTPALDRTRSASKPIEPGRQNKGSVFRFGATYTPPRPPRQHAIAELTCTWVGGPSPSIRFCCACEKSGREEAARVQYCFPFMCIWPKQADSFLDLNIQLLVAKI